MKESAKIQIVNPADYPSFRQLGEREQNAVWAALEYISDRRIGKKPKP